MDLEKLRALLTLLRGEGVTEYSDGTVTVKLGSVVRVHAPGPQRQEPRDPLAELERAALGHLPDGVW